MVDRSTDSASDRATWWRARARKTARMINLAWWLETLAAPMLICSAIASAVILFWRNHGGGISIGWITFILAIALVFAAGSWFFARRKFESPAESLVRLEAALGLHNALSTAEAGVASWPEPHGRSTALPDGLRWHWRRLAVPPLVASGALLAALWIPTGTGTAAIPSAPQQPLTWSQLDAELDALMESAVVEEAYVQQTRERVEELRSRDPGEWYSHNTMEATDTIAQAHRNETNRLEDVLGRAQQAVERMRQQDSDARQRQFEEYRKAVEDMASGGMRPNEALREQLEGINPENLNQLTREQLEKLREQLRQANDALRDALQNGLGDEPEGEGDPDGPPGPGGPGEGGRHAPGVLGNLPEHDIEGGEFTPLSAKDLSRAALGDLLETESSPHEIQEPAPTGAIHGGAAGATGLGGDRVWRDTLDPAEQRTLRRFFD